MQESALNYDEIVSHFGLDAITDRYKFLYDKMQAYIVEVKQENTFYVNQNLLQQTVMDYFADIYRLKQFHGIAHINITKIVSYEVYWILRRKPIQLKCESKEVFPNESFSTLFVAHELLIPDETEPLNEEQQKIFIKFLEHFNYFLKYRNVDKQGLELMLLSYETAKNMSKA